jgi:hypothetical protein
MDKVQKHDSRAIQDRQNPLELIAVRTSNLSCLLSYKCQCYLQANTYTHSVACIDVYLCDVSFLFAFKRVGNVLRILIRIEGEGGVSIMIEK